MIPFVIDNQGHHLRDALNELLAQSAGKPLDIATAYFAISGYRLMKDGLHQVGAFRLILGAVPHSGADVGLKPKAVALKKPLQGDLEAASFRRHRRHQQLHWTGTRKHANKAVAGGLKTQVPFNRTNRSVSHTEDGSYAIWWFAAIEAIGLGNRRKGNIIEFAVRQVDRKRAQAVETMGTKPEFWSCARAGSMRRYSGWSRMTPNQERP